MLTAKGRTRPERYTFLPLYEEYAKSELPDCTVDSTAGDAGLLTNLCNRGLLTLGPLAAGVEVDSQGSAKRKAAGVIFPLGALLVGQLLECTAVPELRNQTKAVAGHLLQRLATCTEQQNIGEYRQEKLFA